jgi:hypothetical protein
MEDCVFAETPEMGLANIGRALFFAGPLTPAANVAATAGGQPQDHADRKQVPHGKWTEE